jgi:hypothetical protein
VVAAIEAIAVQPATVASGQPVEGMVTIATAAAAGTVVWLFSSDANVTVPESVAIAEGQTRGSFPVTTRPVILDTLVAIRAVSGTSARSASLQLIAPPPTLSGTFLRFVSDPDDRVGRGQSLRLEASPTVRFQALVSTWSTGSSFRHQLSLIVMEMGDDYRDWGLTLTAPRGERLAPGIYRGAKRFSENGGPEISFGGDGRGCNDSTGEFEIFEARYAPRPPNGERIERFVARFRQTCEGATGGLSGELSLTNVAPF